MEGQVEDTTGRGALMVIVVRSRCLRKWQEQVPEQQCRALGGGGGSDVDDRDSEEVRAVFIQDDHTTWLT